MKKGMLLGMALVFILRCYGQAQSSLIRTDDIGRFWEAYDQIIQTKDSTRQYQYLQQLYLDKASPGLKALMQVRQYTAQSYLDAIRRYPLFWQSVRANTLRAQEYSRKIEAALPALAKLYPALKPAKVYFSIGALLSNGTTLDSMVLIGTEVAMGDAHTVTSEFPPRLGHLRGFFDHNRLDNIVLLNMHEYVHTQQKTTIGNTLLAQCVLEGVAEFLSTMALKQPSASPAIAYGRKHKEQVRDRFAIEMFSPYTNNWLYNDTSNTFHIRDLGYYTGYAICERYYQKATDKQQAIRKMIELDYNQEQDLARFTDSSGYFTLPMAALKQQYEDHVPFVTRVEPAVNGATKVEPGIRQITVTFSCPMDKRYRGFDYGPAGETQVLKIGKVQGFSADGHSVTFEARLEPGRHYQLLLTSSFRSEEGIPMKPYLIEWDTTL